MKPIEIKATINGPRHSAGAEMRSAASIAARKLSSGRRQNITSNQLIEHIKGTRKDPEFQAHLFGFFEELPLEMVHDVALDENIDFVLLASVAKEIGAEGETVEWIEEMASYCVA